MLHFHACIPRNNASTYLSLAVLSRIKIKEISQWQSNVRNWLDIPHLTAALCLSNRKRERRREKGFRERNRWVGGVVVEGSCIFTGMAAITRPREIQLSGVVETAVARNDISPLPRFRHSLKFIRIRRSVSVGELVRTCVSIPEERSDLGKFAGKISSYFVGARHVCPAPPFRNYLNTSRPSSYNLTWAIVIKTTSWSAKFAEFPPDPRVYFRRDCPFLDAFRR